MRQIFLYRYLPFLLLQLNLIGVFSLTTNAQNVIWSNGYTTATSNMTIHGVRSNSLGENITVGSFSKKLDFDAGPGNDTVDAAGLTGSSASIASFISKTDNSGNHIWVKIIMPYTQYARSDIYDVDLDAAANIYVVGSFRETVDFDPGIAVDSANSHNNDGCFIMKLDPVGNLVWVHTFLGINTYMWDLKIDENDGVVISGSFSDTVDFDPGPAVFNMVPANYSTKAVYVLKLNANGNFLWANSWGYTKSNNNVSSVETDTFNNVYVSGVIHPQWMDMDPGPGVTVDTGNSFVIKLDPSGNFIWGKALPDKLSTVIAASGTNQLYVCGEPLLPINTMKLSAYDFSGTLLWTKMLEYPQNPGQLFPGHMHSSTRDQSGNLYVAGFGASGYFMHCSDSIGNPIWSKVSGVHFELDGIKVRVSPLNELLVTGDFRDVLDVDFGAGIDTLGAALMYSGFLMKYHFCGNNYTSTYNGCDSVVLADTTYLNSVEYMKEFVDINGCDSTVTFDINLNMLHDTVLNVCDSAVIYGQVYTQSGIYTQIVPNAPGCDSVMVVEVNINTPANSPVFMNLIQILPDPYMGFSIEIDSAYNIYVSGGGGGPIPELGMNNAAYAYVSEHDSAGILTWRHKTIHQNAQQYLYSNVLCSDDTNTLHAGTMYYNVQGYNNNNAGTEEIFQPNNVYNDTAAFTNMMVNNKLCYKEILNDPLSNTLIYVGTIPQSGVLNNPGKIYVKRGNSTYSFCSTPNAWGGGTCYPRTATVDSQGNIYIAGHWQDPPVAAGIGQYGAQYNFVAKLDSNLNLLWNKINTNGPVVSKMIMDGNTIILCGGAGASTDVDLSPNVQYANGEGGTLVARYDTAFNVIWATRYGRLGSVNAKAIAADHNGNVYVGGEFSDLIDLNPGPGNAIYNEVCDSTDWNGGYISKFSSAGGFVRAMGTGKFIYELQYKYPKRLYAAGFPMVQVFELASDTTVYLSFTICIGDSIVVGNSVYFQSGIYTDVFLSANNTDSIVIINLTVNPLPVVMANATDTILCSGDSVILSGTGALNYTWSNGVIDSMPFSPNITNNFIVSGTDTNGCINTDSITIIVNPLPNVIANASDTSLCIGDSVILFGSGALSYVWNNLVADSMIFSPIITNNYLVSGTDTNGCLNTDSITIVVNALPVVTANASDSTLCIGDSVVLYGSGAVSYSWNNGVIDNAIFLTLFNTSYLVSGTDTNGCINTDSITLTVNPLPVVVANASDTSVCIGNAVILFGTGADSFSWTNNVSDSLVFYPIDTAMYLVTGIDLNGCIGQDSIEVITYQQPFPILVFSGDTLFCTNVSNVNYYWFKDTVAVDSLINYYVVTQNGNYEVLVVDTNGCVGADSISMLNVGLSAKSESSLIKVYPNPTHREINISFEMGNPGHVDLILYDLPGKQVYASKNSIQYTGNQLLNIDLSKLNLTKGIYFLNMMIEGKRHVVKVNYQKQ